nr:hypothetical protein Hi04_10k_c5801_00007 [uncultured bacterium]
MGEFLLEGLLVPASHPALQGHFPGRPVVPGVVLLDEVVAAIAQWQHQSFVPTGFPSVKFLQPLLPGETYSIRLNGDAMRIVFECAAGERVLLRGTVTGAVS